ncbi:hypothetical protein BDY24DRAFT_397248 [Mrakia frigida]|uniref:uncharacterized protein n=1 Tax=Mrakia frigida TaxID=29902 RepID=UPI003FCC0669
MHEPHIKFGDELFFFFIAAVILLVCLGGIFAGLTLGLLSLDTVHLNVLAEAGKNDNERTQAKTVLRLFEGGGRHTLLVVLLLANTLVNTSLPVFLDTVVGGGIAAILASTALIVVFGEIIPQAVCSRWGLPIGAAATPYVRVLMACFYPIAKPIAMLLDKTVGHSETSTYSKPQLKRFMSLGVEQEGSQAEVKIIESVLELGEKSVSGIMTPLEDVYTLAADELMDGNLVEQILFNGYSRIPIHEPGSPKSFIGILLVKRLLAYDPDDRRSAGSFVIAPLPECEPTLSCLEALNYFQSGRSHMLLVSRQPGEPNGGVGVVTLEDVVEEMIGAEIVDETDLYVDVHSKIRVVRPSSENTQHTRGLSKVVEGLAKANLRPHSTARVHIPPSPTIQSLSELGLDLDLGSVDKGSKRRSLSLGRDSTRGRTGGPSGRVGRLVELGDSPTLGHPEGNGHANGDGKVGE